MTRLVMVTVCMGLCSAGICLDLDNLPVNEWVAFEPVVDNQCGVPGTYSDRAWYGNATYNIDQQEILIYDGWQREESTHWSIYSNATFGLSMVGDQYTVYEVSNWAACPKDYDYVVYPLPANETQPTPCPRHTYECYVYVPQTRSLYLMEGANVRRADECGGDKIGSPPDGWIYSFELDTWRPLPGLADVVDEWSLYEHHFVYWPEFGSIIYTRGSSTWIFDPILETWEEKHPDSTPGYSLYSSSSAPDPQRNRALFFGIGDEWNNTYLDDIFAYDPVTDSWSTLPVSGPRPAPRGHGAFVYINKYDVFMTFGGGTADSINSSGFRDTWIFNPRSSTWELVAATCPDSVRENQISMAYDPVNDVVGVKGYGWAAFRYVPQDSPRASFALEQTGAHVDVDASSSSVAPGRTIVSYEWDFDYDHSAFNATGNGAAASHDYTRFGVRYVALKVTDSSDDIDIASRKITVSSDTDVTPPAPPFNLRTDS